ncbi:MAG: hypothetical protein ACN6PD_06965 [Sphingobacterium sp.]
MYTEKKQYTSPGIEVLYVQLEQGIAVGSASNNSEDSPTNKWEVDRDDNRTINW